MDFFDLHCDTVSRLTEGGGIADADAHINLEKARTLGRWAQVFAVFVQDNAPGADTAYASYRLQTACFRAQLAANREQIVQCRTAQETKDAFEEGRRAAILSVENGAALGGSLERLAEFQRDGVRFLTLTWMGENELGCGGEAGGPLTEFGRAVVRALPQYGIVPDVSHLSDEGVADVFECYDGPVVATHSNVRRVTGHHRNLTEKQIREIVRRGGLIGINLCSAFLSSDRMRACSDDVYRHLDAFLSLGAQDTVCFGTDFDGAHVPEDIRDIGGIPRLYGYLLARGLPETVLNKVFFENAWSFWKRTF